jgi:uncharacterized protein YuzE
MKIEYDSRVDVLMIYLREGDYASSDEVAPNMIVDFDDAGAPMAIEILNARSLLNIEGSLMLELPFDLERAG